MDYLLRVADVTKKYGAFRALEGVSLLIPRNKVTCIVGKNGSGKTTLLRLLTGRETITRGEIYHRKSEKDAVMSGGSEGLSIGFCAQENNLPSLLSVSELIQLFSSFAQVPVSAEKKKEEIRLLLGKVNVSGLLHSKYGSLSIGAKRKVSLLVALVNKAPLIMLDEPMAGLD